MGGRKRKLLVVGGAIMFVAGLPGLFEDLATWKGWLAMLSPWMWFSLVGIVLGLGLVIYGLFSGGRDDQSTPATGLSEQATLNAMEIERSKHASLMATIQIVIFLVLFLGGGIALVAFKEWTRTQPSERSSAGVSTTVEDPP